MKTHRWVGLTAAIFLFMLTTTGIALQHPVAFGLDQRFVQSQALLSWYGIKLEAVQTAYQLDEHYLILADGEVYWRNQPLLQIETLTGATLTGGTLAFTDQAYFYLFDADTFEAIEKIKTPETVHQSGSINNRLVLRSADTSYRLSQDQSEFFAVSALDEQAFNQPITIPQAVQDRLNQTKISRFISWQRFLTDLHSGRLFGKVGPLVIDLVALAVLLLAITGLWNWSTRRRLP